MNNIQLGFSLLQFHIFTALYCLQPTRIATLPLSDLVKL